ncbi:MAG: general secretion pathway protein GspK [Nitrospirae bacterium]|nr:general secretion pathway protein GspK [Nitrospirota bacterium]
MRYTQPNNGSATILTLLISAVIITVGIGFNWLVKEHLRAAEGLKNKTEAMLNAHSAYESLIYGILSGTLTQKEVVLNKGEDILGVKSIPINGSGVSISKGVTIRIQDSNGILSLGNPDTDVIKRLVKLIVPENNNVSVITDSFLDWIDHDKLTHINGAEDMFYRSEGKPYTARNYPVQYKEEFSFIRGMDEGMLIKLSPYITLLPNMGFNPNTAPDEVLMAYLDIDKDTMRDLKNYISDKSVSSDTELFGLTGRKIVRDEGIYFFPSRFWEITIDSGSPKRVYSIHAGVDIRYGLRFPYSVIYWKEE